MLGHEITRKFGIVTWAAALVFVVCGACWADTYKVKGSETQTGTFMNYENNRFILQPSQGKEVHQARNNVMSLELDPPAKVAVKLRGKNALENLVFKGYNGSRFLFDRGGKEEAVMPNEVVTIETTDLDRTVEVGGAKVISTGEEVDISKFVKQGIPTIVHFHSPDVTASVRQGGYAESKVKESGTRMLFLKIEMSDANSAVAKQYEITTLPTFWFYNMRAKLVRKLADRFTEQDIDAAIKEAKQTFVDPRHAEKKAPGGKGK